MACHCSAIILKLVVQSVMFFIFLLGGGLPSPDSIVIAVVYAEYFLPLTLQAVHSVCRMSPLQDLLG